MNLDNGFVKLYRKITEWEWYNNIPTKVLFLHLILTANWCDKKWQGITIRRGQRVCTIRGLAEETNLSVRNVRTALDNLKTTQEVTQKSSSNYTIISIKNYDTYQMNDTESGTQPTHDRHTTDTDRRIYKELKEDKEYITPPQSISIRPVRVREEEISEAYISEYGAQPSADDLQSLTQAVTAAECTDKKLVTHTLKLSRKADKNEIAFFIGCFRKYKERGIHNFLEYQKNEAKRSRKVLPKNTAKKKDNKGDTDIILDYIKDFEEDTSDEKYS